MVTVLGEKLPIDPFLVHDEFADSLLKLENNSLEWKLDKENSTDEDFLVKGTGLDNFNILYFRTNYYQGNIKSEDKFIQGLRFEFSGKLNSSDPLSIVKKYGENSVNSQYFVVKQLTGDKENAIYMNFRGIRSRHHLNFREYNGPSVILDSLNYNFSSKNSLINEENISSLDSILGNSMLNFRDTILDNYSVALLSSYPRIILSQL